MARPVIKNEKQPPPKKLSPAEQITAAEKRSDAIQNYKQPKIKPRTLTEVSDLPKPFVFYNHHRQIYLLVSENHVSSRYLIMGNEQIEVVKLKHSRPPRDEKGFLLDKTTCISELFEYEYDLKKAANKFLNSLLPKSSEAVRELYRILGKPVPEITEEEKIKHNAKVERMKKAREVLVIARKEKAEKVGRSLFTSSGWPRGGTIVTIAKIVPGYELDAKRKVIVDALRAAGGSQTVGQLRRSIGNNSADAVVKALFELKLVTLS